MCLKIIVLLLFVLILDKIVAYDTLQIDSVENTWAKFDKLDAEKNSLSENDKHASLNLTISRLDDLSPAYLNCVQTKENLAEYKVIVSEGNNFILHVDPPKGDPENISGISCFDDSHEINHLEIPVSSSFDFNNPVNVKVTNNMGGVWNCTVFMYRDNRVVLPQEIVDDHKYAVASCYIQVHVRPIDSPQMVLVNNVVLPTSRTSLEERVIDHSAQYRYLHGDRVSVSCVKDKQPCKSIEMRYIFVNSDGIFETEVMKSAHYVSSRSTLVDKYDNCCMICVCVTEGDIFTTQVTFKLENLFEYGINVSANGLAWRHGTLGTEMIKTYKYDYMFNKGENLDINCETDLENGKIKRNCDMCYCDTDGKKQISCLELTNSIQVICKLYQNKLTEEVEINLKPLSEPITEPSDLFLKVPQNNMLLEMYDNITKIIYYEFEEGDSLNITCLNKKAENKIIVIDGKDSEPNVPEFSISLPLNSSNDNRTLVFSLMENSHRGPRKISDKIKLIIRKKRPQITTTNAPTTTTSVEMYDVTATTMTVQVLSTTKQTHTSDSGNSTLPILAVIGCLVCLGLVIAFFVMKKMKQKQQDDAGEATYQNFGVQHNGQPNLRKPRAEEPRYDVAADQRNDNAIYSEPVGIDTYAVPIPKNQRNKPSTEPTYADLEFTNKGPPRNFVNVKTQYATVGELYSQVLPKSARQGDQSAYGNVFPDSQYANSGPTEYVEPAYCVPNKLR
ncbi:uncharacterized protein LOC142984849 [Anticarsia gemmatalis]|uniref:uncharacterized protein LOC142984849 n=1 Tax=Anticarsia gemmatalis TaxID=129554 RepID=UPI003F763014